MHQHQRFGIGHRCSPVHLQREGLRTWRRQPAPPLHSQPGCSTKHAQRRGCQRIQAVVDETQSQVKPAYNKYRSRTDIEQAYIRQWKRTTARDGDIKPRTVLSTLGFIPIWLKYHAVPNILRYAWFIVWSAVRRQYFRFHTWAVLQGAKADLWLAQKGGRPLRTFSRSRVMRRWHFRLGQWDDLRYRYRLLKGQPVEAQP